VLQTHYKHNAHTTTDCWTSLALDRGQQEVFQIVKLWDQSAPSIILCHRGNPTPERNPTLNPTLALVIIGCYLEIGRVNGERVKGTCVDANIADVGGGVANELPLVAGVSQQLLVARQGGVEDHLPHLGFPGVPERLSVPDRPIRQDQPVRR
jgi:hypothetical protein